jgi:endonuclease YncB( thermonuclease family)
MTQGVSSSVANLALAVGIAAAVAIAVAFAVPRYERGAAPAVLPASAPEGKGGIYLHLPPLPKGTTIPAKASEPAAVPPVDTSRSGDMAEPFEPPAPPTVEVAQAPARPAAEQVAALTPPEAPPVAAPPPLRTVALENHEIHAVPQRDAPTRRVTIVNREDRPAPVERAPAKHAETALPRHRDLANGAVPVKPATAEVGVKLAGPAIVTGALELNVAGKALQLYGVKAPTNSDMCAPNADYAARSCPDVSRQALAARIGTDGEVSCRILATGGRQSLPAVCKDSTGADLAAYLVQHGFALAEANDMMIDYSAAETQAKGARTGLWSYR